MPLPPSDDVEAFPQRQEPASACAAGETAIYRALLTAILHRSYARAYGHAA